MGTIWEQMLYLRHNKIIQPMKATAFIRKTASKNDTNSVATIYFRLRDGKKDIKAASELTINPNHWSSEKQGYKDRVALVSEEKKQALNNEVQNILNLINQNYTPESDSEWLSTLIITTPTDTRRRRKSKRKTNRCCLNCSLNSL